MVRAMVTMMAIAVYGLQSRRHQNLSQTLSTCHTQAYEIVHIYVRTRMQTQTCGLPPTHAPYNPGEGDEGTAAGPTAHGRRQVRWLFGSVGIGVSVRANVRLGSQTITRI